MSYSDKFMYRELVTVIIEKALIGIGMPVYEAVVATLRNKYHCNIEDCYENPGYLRNALEEYFGTASNAVVDTINNDLEMATKNPTIDRFLLVLNK